MFSSDKILFSFTPVINVAVSQYVHRPTQNASNEHFTVRVGISRILEKCTSEKTIRTSHLFLVVGYFLLVTELTGFTTIATKPKQF